MVLGNNESTTTKNNKANRWQFRLPCRCGGTMRGTSPNEAHPGLHSKPLDAAIGRVPAPYRPDGRHGRRIRTKHTNTNKTQLLPSDYRTFKIVKAKQFRNPKGTLYSRHRCDELRLNAKHHD